MIFRIRIPIMHRLSKKKHSTLGKEAWYLGNNLRFHAMRGQYPLKVLLSFKNPVPKSSQFYQHQGQQKQFCSLLGDM